MTPLGWLDRKTSTQTNKRVECFKGIGCPWKEWGGGGFVNRSCICGTVYFILFKKMRFGHRGNYSLTKQANLHVFLWEKPSKRRMVSKNYFPLKAPYSLKMDIFIQERFIKSIYGINTIIKCGNLQSVMFQLVSRSWNKMIFLSYLWINFGNISSEIR